MRAPARCSLAVAAAAQNSDGPEGVEPQEPPAAADGREPRAAEAPSRERAEEADEPAAARDEAGTEAPASAPSPDIAALNPLAGLDKGSLAGFRDAPLFTPSRRRPAPPPAVAEAPPPPPPPPRPSARPRRRRS
ncbi:hypothetical protein [Chenggangzhangella methanolivorans]|uniref:Uncharacterized protein n=1 Tax=Chenggangzhangella methanolivorans TaxID=1437009 RepID=A0A9E6UPU1_9HYPH|nr:hypothetical protein [Chenggangzhangella methanolivorans]QZO01819.1 hypothetical protein K6K41_10925 [Chenggangzhangella methanolivorans]